MTGIKGVGTALWKRLSKSAKEGPFTSLYQFFKRIDTKRVGKKVVENLVDAGCFDFTGWSRDALRQSVDPMYDTVAKEQADRAKGFMSLFELMGESNEERFASPPEVKRKSLKQENLLKEKELLGFFLTGHPLEEFKTILKQLSCIPLYKVEEMDHDAVFRAAFLIEIGSDANFL